MITVGLAIGLGADLLRLLTALPRGNSAAFALTFGLHALGRPAWLVLFRQISAADPDVDDLDGRKPSASWSSCSRMRPNQLLALITQPR